MKPINIFCIWPFLLGLREFRSALGRTYGHPETPESRAYEWGREWAHRLTFRRYEE